MNENGHQKSLPHTDHASAYCSLVGGLVMQGSGRTEKAERLFQRAVSDGYEERDYSTVGWASSNLGQLAYLRHEYGSALTSFTLAMAAFSRADDCRGIADVNGRIRDLHFAQGDVASALEAASQAVVEADASDDAQLVAKAILRRAELRFSTGSPRLAYRELDLAITARLRGCARVSAVSTRTLQLVGRNET